MDFLIRPENRNDFEKVFEIHLLAFGRENEAKLVHALRKNPKVFIPELSLVASVNNMVVGHILFTKISIINHNSSVFESLALAPMAVKPDFQKRGIGGKLIKTGLDNAKDLNYKSVIVLGHKHYYPKFGFVPTNKWNITSPFDAPAEAFMAVELIQNGLKDVSGTVKYPLEFELV